MTAQIHERLVLDGVETSMAYCPPLPYGHPRICEPKPDESLDEADFILASTACWRGYQGAWEVRDGRFYLIGLCGRFQLLGDEPIHADWFSGVLRVPRGEKLQHIHMGFGSIYEQEVHIEIVSGVVVATSVIDNHDKNYDEFELGWKNLPGGENRFPGDGDI